MRHSQGSGYGENLYMTTGSVDNGKDAVTSWYDEIHLYNFGNQGFRMGTGKFIIKYDLYSYKKKNLYAR